MIYITALFYLKIKNKSTKISRTQFVPEKGLEPLHLSVHGPEPCVSANSTTPARVLTNMFANFTTWALFELYYKFFSINFADSICACTA